MHPSAPAPAATSTPAGPDRPAPDRPAPDLQPPTPPTPLPCPDCAALLPASPAGCPACGLPLRGPAAARLWDVDRQLAELGARAGDLRRERVSLLQVLRGAASPLPEPHAAPQPRAEWDLRRVQSTLLAAGALLLCVAAAVFAAVTYDELGLVGQAIVLLGLTAGAAVAVPRLVRRGLGATAEAVAAVTLALTVLDAYAARRTGLAGLDGVEGAAYWAAAFTVVALLAGAASLRLPGMHVPVLAAVGAAQLPVLIAAAEAGGPAAAWLLLGQAGLDLLALLALRRAGHPRLDTRTLRLADRALAVAGLAVGALSALSAGAGLLETTYLDRSPAAPALALTALAALALAAVPQAATRRGRELLAALPVLLTAAAVAGLVLASPAATAGVSALALPLAAVGTLATAGATAAAHLSRVDWEAGSSAAGLVVLAVGVAPVVPDAAVAVVGPLAWPERAWSLTASTARSAVSPEQPWTGDLHGPAVLALAAAGVLVAAAGAHLRSAPLGRLVGAAGAVLVWAAALTLPLALDTSYAVALAADVTLGTALLATAIAARRRATGAPVRSAADGLLLAGAATLVLTAAWATAVEAASLVVLPLVAALLGVSAGLLGAGRGRGPLVLVAGLAAGAALTAVTVSTGAPAERAGFLLLAVPAALLALAARPGRLGRDRGLGAEGAATLLTLTALGLARGDTGWFAWTLAAAGLLALAAALRAERRRLAPLGGLLLAASSWVRLDAAGVDAPEPYVVPVALVALALGHSRRRRDPGTSSRAAYGAGLTGLLLPSLVATLGDPTLVRTLLLGAVALGVALVGARARLAAPLVAGTAVLTVLALQQLAPLADALPRWTALAVAGAVLLSVGATYEQRRRDVARLREAYRALA